MKAKDIMTSPAVTARVDEKLDVVAQRMLQGEIGSVVIVDAAGNATGIVTESDFMAQEAGLPFSTFRMPKLWGQWIGRDGLEDMYQQARAIEARAIMQPHLVSVVETDSPEHVVDLMLKHRIKHVPVLRNGKPVGMIARHDMLRMIHRKVAA